MEFDFLEIVMEVKILIDEIEYLEEENYKRRIKKEEILKNKEDYDNYRETLANIGLLNNMNKREIAKKHRVLKEYYEIIKENKAFFKKHETGYDNYIIDDYEEALIVFLKQKDEIKKLPEFQKCNKIRHNIVYENEIFAIDCLKKMDISNSSSLRRLYNSYLDSVKSYEEDIDIGIKRASANNDEKKEENYDFDNMSKHWKDRAKIVKKIINNNDFANLVKEEEVENHFNHLKSLNNQLAKQIKILEENPNYIAFDSSKKVVKFLKEHIDQVTKDDFKKFHM